MFIANSVMIETKIIEAIIPTMAEEKFSPYYDEEEEEEKIPILSSAYYSAAGSNILFDALVEMQMRRINSKLDALKKVFDKHNITPPPPLKWNK